MTAATATLLVELLTEELPPKALKRLGEAFGALLTDHLRDDGFLTSASISTSYATPRRLAVSITNVVSEAPDREVSQRLMPRTQAEDALGKPTPALIGRLKKAGRGHLASGYPDARDGPDHLYVQSGEKGDYAWLSSLAKGPKLMPSLQGALEDAIDRLPIPKVMRYARPGSYYADVKFVRPAHRLVALHGREVVPLHVLGLEAGRQTLGHRFLAEGDLTVSSADDWEKTLEIEGRVIASFSKRRERVKQLLQRLEDTISSGLRAEPGGRRPMSAGDIRVDLELAPGVNPGYMFPATTDFDAIDRALGFGGGADLLDDVTALVEWPCAYWGRFDETFLELPIECIALTMKLHQRYFPVFSNSARLLPCFGVVSNMDLQDPTAIVAGNERVVRPRLSDAKFFFDADRKVPLADWVTRLATIVFHNQLGFQLERVERIRFLAEFLTESFAQTIKTYADRAAELCKADLLSQMVGEFPELQGIMGRYYALAAGESEIVAGAIEQHYWPKFSGDRLPEGNTARALAVADRVDSLVGLFAAGERASGDADRYGLRRLAIGLLRILLDWEHDVDIFVLLDRARIGFSREEPRRRYIEAFKQLEEGRGGVSASGRVELTTIPSSLCNEIYDFLLERLRNLLRDQGRPQNVVDAALALRPRRLSDIASRLDAIEAFLALPEARALAIANKRVRNILSKSGGEALPALKRDRLTDGAEKNLCAELEQRLLPIVHRHVAQGDFKEALLALASVRGPVDRFFDEVMVMVEDPDLRGNRLRLLHGLAEAMNQVADISKLVT